MKPRVIEVSLPQYHIREKPDYLRIGRIVDNVIERSLPNGKYVVRAIGVDDHPGLSLNKLTQIIMDTGTDKYDPKRIAVCHEEFSGYDYDIQASTMEIKNARIVIPASYKHPSEFADIVYHFYEHAPLDRGYAVRIDLLLIYDRKALRSARKTSPKAPGVRKGLSKCLFTFKDPARKRDALVGVVKILRK